MDDLKIDLRYPSRGKYAAQIGRKDAKPLVIPRDHGPLHFVCLDWSWQFLGEKVVPIGQVPAQVDHFWLAGQQAEVAEMLNIDKATPGKYHMAIGFFDGEVTPEIVQGFRSAYEAQNGPNSQMHLNGKGRPTEYFKDTPTPRPPDA